MEALGKSITVGENNVSSIKMYMDDPRNFNGAVMTFFAIKFEDGTAAELSSNEYYIIERT